MTEQDSNRHDQVQSAWPNDADGDVLRRMKKRGFDFDELCLIEFNVDFYSWPPPEPALKKLAYKFQGLKLYPSSDGGGYVQLQVYDRLTYDLVINTQRDVSEEMSEFDGVCNSWGVLH